MIDNRGMSPAQAKALASDPKTSPGILTRLANGYPDVWNELLANPALPADIRAWITKSLAEPLAESSIPKTVAPPKSTKEKVRRRRTHGRFVRTLAILIVPALSILGLNQLVQFLDQHRPALGIVTMQELAGVGSAPDWTFGLASGGPAECTQYELGTVSQGEVVVLTQNDVGNKKCKDVTTIPSTLALVNLATGKASWKIDLAGELDWTEKWHKQLIEVPGLNEVLVKFTDVNGSDAGGNTKSIDKGDDRKMKTIVPYNRLNGRITDPVIAKSNSQPIMQAPVLQVMAIPGNLRSVLVMTNGAKKDFRYAKYRSKRFSSARWSVESDLRPMGGSPIIGNKLILGRVKGDQPAAINLGSGRIVGWNGHAEAKLYRIAGQPVEILGDGVSEKATNLTSQGGPKGHDITINGIDGQGNTKWTLDANGYAISRDDSRTTPYNRGWYHRLFVLDGKNNQFVSMVDPKTGSTAWRTKISQQRFEISRTTSGDRVAVYLFKKLSLETKSFTLLDLSNGTESEELSIAGKQVRVDGATKGYSILVDEPDRAKIIKEAEDGKVAALDRKDRSNSKRICVQGISNPSSNITWDFECNGNQHALRSGGSWLLLDLTPGREEFWPMKGGN